MEHPTWQRTQEFLGMPAARTFEQSILLAQLEIMRRLDPSRVAAARKVFHTVNDEKGEVSESALLTLALLSMLAVIGLSVVYSYLAYGPIGI